MQTTNYTEAKEDLRLILDQKDDDVLYDDSLQQIIHTSNNKELNLDKSKLGIRISLFLFFFGMMLVAGRKDLTTSFILYSAGIGLLITFVSSVSMSKKHEVIVDFDKEVIKRNNKTIKFSECKGFIVTKMKYNWVTVAYFVTIETRMGKINISLIALKDEDVTYGITAWANTHIRC